MWRRSVDVKYNEEAILKEISEYVLSTYGQHYVGNGGYQTIDVWETMGICEEVCAGTALKYIMRFGKKEGKNKKDLLKAVHYIVLLMHFSGVMNETHNREAVEVKPNKR